MRQRSPPPVPGAMAGSSPPSIRALARVRPAPDDALTSKKALLPASFGSFALDAGLEASASQQQLYSAVQPLVSSLLLQGQDGVVIAYGSARSGKSYTLEVCYPRAVGPLIAGISRGGHVLTMPSSCRVLAAQLAKGRAPLCARWMPYAVTWRWCRAASTACTPLAVVRSPGMSAADCRAGAASHHVPYLGAFWLLWALSPHAAKGITPKIIHHPNHIKNVSLQASVWGWMHCWLTWHRPARRQCVCATALQAAHSNAWPAARWRRQRTLWRWGGLAAGVGRGHGHAALFGGSET